MLPIAVMSGDQAGHAERPSGAAHPRRRRLAEDRRSVLLRKYVVGGMGGFN